MKNLLNLALTCIMLFSFAACSNDDYEDQKDIELTDGTQTTQTVYADQTSGATNGIKFSTTGAWKATVSEVQVKSTSGSTVDWLKLNQYSGDKADNYTLTLTLTENFTGKDRKAEIKIVSGGTSITITVEQKGITQGGKEPEKPELGKLVTKISSYYNYNGEGKVEGEDLFYYDSKGRISSIWMNFSYDESKNKFQYGEHSKYTYGDRKITEVRGKDGQDHETVVYEVSDEGYIIKGTDERNKDFLFYKYKNGYMIYGKEIYFDKDQVITEAFDWKNGNIRACTNGYGINEPNDPSLESTMYEYSLLENKSNVNLNHLCMYVASRIFLMEFSDFGGKHPKNLISKAGDFSYSYELDKEGDIVKIYEKGGASEKEYLRYTITYNK